MEEGDGYKRQPTPQLLLLAFSGRFGPELVPEGNPQKSTTRELRAQSLIRVRSAVLRVGILRHRRLACQVDWLISITRSWS